MVLKLKAVTEAEVDLKINTQYTFVFMVHERIIVLRNLEINNW